MNKNILFSLIEKEISELEILMKGMKEIEVVSPTLVSLAKSKINDIQLELDQIVSLQPNKTAVPMAEPQQDEPLGTTITSQPAYPEKEELFIKPTLDQANQPSDNNFTVAASASEPSMDDPITKMEKREKESLAEMLNKDKHSLNDLIASQSEASLAETFGSAKVGDLRQAFTLADRFRFQRELFQGNGEKFNLTLRHLNNLESKDEAMRYMQTFGWDEHNQHAQDFIRLVMRKFNP
ncbi:MAG: hypothetical protein ACP5F6_09375 [Microbacter sp.]